MYFEKGVNNYLVEKEEYVLYRKLVDVLSNFLTIFKHQKSSGLEAEQTLNHTADG